MTAPANPGKPVPASIAVARVAAELSGVWDPYGDAREIVACVLGIGPAQVADQELTASQAERLDALARRRADRVPLGHVTGRVFFGGIELAVSPGVFVPRSLSEPLLRWALDELAGRRGPVVVDLCTGSGALALAFAHARPDAHVHAVELDEAALACARANRDRRAAAGDTPVILHADDVTDPGLLADRNRTDLRGRVDLVIANPPYVPEGRELPPEWAMHHPAGAVYSGADGLCLARQVIARASALLRLGGALAMEHDDSQSDTLAALLAGAGFAQAVDHPDHRRNPRFVTATLAAR